MTFREHADDCAKARGHQGLPACPPRLERSPWYNSDQLEPIRSSFSVMKPVNPVFFPALCLGAFANLIVNAADDGKTDTVSSNPLGQMVAAAAVTSSTATVAVSTVVTHTILEGVHETWLNWPLAQGDDGSRR